MKKLLKYWLPRLLAGLLGLVLIIAGVLKSMDMELFIRQLKAYDILSISSIVALSAWGLIIIELILGACLLVGYRLKISLPALGILLLIFILANVWALISGSTSDCGCFGSLLQRNPAEAIAEDLILLIITIFSWTRLKGSAQKSKSKGLYAVIIALLLGLTLPIIFGFSMAGISQPEIGTAEMSLGKFEIKGLDGIDIGLGEYLIVIMGTECIHCQDAVFDLNILVDTENMPEIIALCANEDDQVIRFKEQFQPFFPISKISEEDFWGLLGTGNMPRIILVRDKLVKRVWYEAVPSADEIKSLQK
ncbi:MauE/DoxX family redox-associated membrane protein [Thermodesulfobacteriota bacterium]